MLQLLSILNLKSLGEPPALKGVAKYSFPEVKREALKGILVLVRPNFIAISEKLWCPILIRELSVDL